MCSTTLSSTLGLYLGRYSIPFSGQTVRCLQTLPSVPWGKNAPWLWATSLNEFLWKMPLKWGTLNSPAPFCLVYLRLCITNIEWQNWPQQLRLGLAAPRSLPWVREVLHSPPSQAHWQEAVLEAEELGLKGKLMTGCWHPSSMLPCPSQAGPNAGISWDA